MSQSLETSYADGPETVFKWDGVVRFYAPWNQDQTLSSAYKYSAVWVYQRMATELGYDTMSGWINQLGYGNGTIGAIDDLTTYWLVGPLETSARQQVGFLSRLATGDLPFSADTLRTAKEIMQADQGDGWTLYAKTGWRADGQNVDIGWYVGWVEQSKAGLHHTYVFAFNMDMTEPADRALRISTVRSALAHLGIIANRLD